VESENSAGHCLFVIVCNGGHHTAELTQGAAVRPTPSNVLLSELPELAGDTVLFRIVKLKANKNFTLSNSQENCRLKFSVDVC